MACLGHAVVVMTDEGLCQSERWKSNHIMQLMCSCSAEISVIFLLVIHGIGLFQQHIAVSNEMMLDCKKTNCFSLAANIMHS